MKQLGQELRRRREANGIGLRELARYTDLSPSYLSRIETGDEQSPPSEEAIVGLHRFLGGDLGELLQLAGRIPSDVRALLLADAGLITFLRSARERGLTSADLVRMVSGVKP